MELGVQSRPANVVLDLLSFFGTAVHMISICVQGVNKGHREYSHIVLTGGLNLQSSGEKAEARSQGQEQKTEDTRGRRMLWAD